MRITLALIVGMLACRAMGATITASSPAYADVSNAVASAASGDTVRIPAGGATWTNYLLVRTPISLIGAGTNATHITNDIPPFSPYGSGAFLIVLAPTNDAPIRVSNLRICGNWTNGGGGILVDQYRSTFPGPKPTQLSTYRVDKVAFDYCYPRAFQANGRAFGVVDHCLFLDCYVGHSANGDNSDSWALFTPPLWAMGTTNTKVVESSVFAYTRNLNTSPVPCDAGDGVDYVFRFNTITNTQTSHYIDGLDAHGNNKMLSYEDKRGTIFVEIYGNTINNDRGLKFAKLRGGTVMVYSNTFNAAANYAYNVQLDEEETWATYVYDEPARLLVRTNPPAQDAITNSFIWANTLNGSPLTTEPVLYDADPDYNPITFGTTNNPIALVLSENVDYWRRSPWGGAAYTNRGGGVNAMASYTPLAYPHPRVTAEDGRSVTVTTLNVTRIKPAP